MVYKYKRNHFREVKNLEDFENAKSVLDSQDSAVKCLCQLLRKECKPILNSMKDRNPTEIAGKLFLRGSLDVKRAPHGSHHQPMVIKTSMFNK